MPLFSLHSAVDDMERHLPLILIILDGFGYRASASANAIHAANMPHWRKLWETAPHTLISGSGCDVGLPKGQMGNSEVGHLNLGAGRLVQQDLTRIDTSIADGTFLQNALLVSALEATSKAGKAVHLLGLLSNGGVHSHEAHFHAMVSMANQYSPNSVYCHAFLDGRDTPPKSALTFIESLSTHCERYPNTSIASVIGRYYAMDRDQRWERVAKAYDLIVDGKAPFHASSALNAIAMAYERGETDEFIQATAIGDEKFPIQVKDGDLIIFTNFRADRARHLTQSFVDAEFRHFEKARAPKLQAFISFTSYDANFNIPVAFPPQPLNKLLGELISDHQLTQLRIAETEKYAHVTFFFNGGQEIPFKGEERLLIPSPKVRTYDLQPEMSAPALTTALVKVIVEKKYDVIICNFANADMVGHTGNFEATVVALNSVDQCLGHIIKAAEQVGGELIITADHGNAECMYDPNTGQAHTAHTSDPVPFVYYGRKAKIIKNNGKLSDVAPTMLYLLQLPIPVEMTGTSLLALI